MLSYNKNIVVGSVTLAKNVVSIYIQVEKKLIFLTFGAYEINEGIAN